MRGGVWSFWLKRRMCTEAGLCLVFLACPKLAFCDVIRKSHVWHVLNLKQCGWASVHLPFIYRAIRIVGLQSGVTLKKYDRQIQSWFNLMRLGFNKTSFLGTNNFGNNHFRQTLQKQFILRNFGSSKWCCLKKSNKCSKN